MWIHGSSARGGGSQLSGASRVCLIKHIPPTPERAIAAPADSDGAPTAAAATEDEQDGAAEVRVQRSYISGTIFTSGLNQPMRGHVLDASAARAGAVTCITDVGNCLGCKEPNYAGSDTDGGGSEDDDEAVCLLLRLSLMSMAKRFSLVHVLVAAARRRGGGVAYSSLKLIWHN